MFRKAYLKHRTPDTNNLLMRRWHFCVTFDVTTMMAGKNQAALAVCTQTKAIFPFNLASDVLLPFLLQMINISLHTGVFPDVLKEARVIPIHKSGPSEDPSNYRPISILPIVSKVIEKHVSKHLFAYLNKYKLLHEAQSGFRKLHSCQTALIKLKQYSSTSKKLLMLLIMKYVCKNWLYTA